MIGFLKRIFVYLDDLSGQLAALLNIPWAKTYVLLLLACIFLFLLYALLRTLLKPVGSFLLKPFHLLKELLSESAKRSSEERAAMKKIKKALAENDYKSAAELYHSIGESAKAAMLYMEAKKYVSAARIYEEAGDFEKAALAYRDADNHTKAAENFLKIKDNRNAALMFEKAGFFLKSAELYNAAGDPRKAAEVYETCFLQEGSRASLDPSRRGYAQMSGKLFKKAGEPDRAIQILLKAGLFNEAALVHEAEGDFAGAAECYLQAGNLEAAAVSFQQAGNSARFNEIMSAIRYRKGNIEEAASFAEKAGDLLRAAEMFIEIEDYSRAGELFARKEHFIEAGEMFLKVSAFGKAAEAFERGGKYGLAAEAYQKAGDPPLRIAELYEKGEDYFEAGNLFLQLKLVDRALDALQKVLPESADYHAASVMIGKIFLKKSMPNLAIGKFTNVIGNKPPQMSNLELYYYLARCYEISGEEDKAKSIYEKILAENYRFNDVSERLARLSLNEGRSFAPKSKIGGFE